MTWDAVASDLHDAMPEPGSRLNRRLVLARARFLAPDQQRDEPAALLFALLSAKLVIPDEAVWQLTSRHGLRCGFGPVRVDDAERAEIARHVRAGILEYAELLSWYCRQHALRPASGVRRVDGVPAELVALLDAPTESGTD